MSNSLALKRSPAPASPPEGIDLEAIYASRRISGAYPVDTWIHLFTYLQQQQQQTLQRWMQTSLIVGGLILGMLIGLPLTHMLLSWLIGFLPEATVIESLLNTLVSLVGLGMFIAIFVVIGQTGRTVSKYKWSPPEVGILPMLHLLRSEVRPHTAVQLDIDLSGWHVPARRVNTREHKDDQATIDYYYVDPWLHGEVRLADGSRLRWQYRHHIRERQRTYQRISGQVRTKSKTRHFQVCTVKLRLRRRRYPHVHSAPQDGDATITQTQSDEHFRIKVRQKHAGAPEYLDVQPLVTGIAHAYRQIDISGDAPATPQPVQQQANVAPTPGATAGAVPQSTDHGLTIVAPDLQQGLLQAQARGAGVGAYISRHNGQLYLSLDFIHDTQERQQVQHLLQRYQAGETLDVETLSWLGKRLLG